MIKNIIGIIYISAFFYGCAMNRGVENINNEKLEMFGQLFKDHCFEFESKSAVDNNAKQHSIWTASKQWKGTYEFFFQAVSYRLTPRNEENCTVDLLVIQNGHILFTEQEVKDYISEITGYAVYSVDKVMDTNSKDDNISISEVVFKRDEINTNYIMLQYPLERFGEYFVTLNYYY